MVLRPLVDSRIVNGIIIKHGVGENSCSLLTYVVAGNHQNLLRGVPLDRRHLFKCRLVIDQLVKYWLDAFRRLFVGEFRLG